MTADGRHDVGERRLIDLDGLSALVEELRSSGYRVVGPTVRDGAVVYDELESADDLPVGWTDEQDGGHYRLKRRDDEARFGYAVGPHSWKQFLFPPRTLMWSASRTDDGFEIEQAPEADDTPYAFIGARSCELHAIAIQDRVFLDGATPDAIYEANRRRLFTVAVNCGEPGGTCFCVSMETGPKATFGYDLALTELLDGTRHEFLVEVGTPEGAAVLEAIGSEPAGDGDVDTAQRVVDSTAARMGRKMDTTGIQQLLADNLEHGRWDDVASRCLTCANCTLVCPTCFCHGVEDTTDLSGDHAERWRSWDSCFTLDYSYVHGGTVRTSTRSRYRQWLTHKLGTWFDQYGTSGCVGCGRCITWCPVGIDLTEELRAIRAEPPDQQRGAAMSVKSIRDLLATHDFFAGLDSVYLDLVAGCGVNEHYEPSAFILREGEAADNFYVLRTGVVAIEIHTPQRGALVVETLGPGDVLGWSWLVPPWRWHFDARAVEPTNVIALDGVCLRDKCDTDPKLGFELLQRFVRVIAERLQETRLQLLDVYGHARAQ